MRKHLYIWLIAAGFIAFNACKKTVGPEVENPYDKVVIVKDGKGKFVNVETGLRTASGVEILKGVNVGDSVVVTGLLFVRPNATVKIRSVKKAEEIIK